MDLPELKARLHANLDAAFALHCALIAYRLYRWKNNVLRFIDNDCPAKMQFPATDVMAMPVTIIKRFYPDIWKDFEFMTLGDIHEHLQQALYPLPMSH